MQESEPRRDLPVPIRVEMRRPDGTTTVEYAVNISPGGVCLHLSRGLSEGDEVRVEFTLPPSGPTVRADASVVWISSPEAEEGHLAEIGLRLSGLEEMVRRQLAEYASQPINRRR
jgi:c-di-GMP-binding flagellar brake protein YcgR